MDELIKLRKNISDQEQNLLLYKETEKAGKIGGWKFDPVTLKQTWTDGVFQILEIDLSEGAPEVPKGLGFIDPEFRPMAEQAIQRAMELGEPYNQEWVAITAKGHKKWVNAVGNPKIEDGKVVSISGSFQDITSRKIAEENLKNTFNLSPSIITKANLNTGFYVEANQAVTRILGYSVEEFTSKPYTDLVHPDDIQRTAGKVSEQSKGNDVFTFENRFLCKDVSFKWL